ncbi:MAG: nuclear transport factor 2 family protein, partial [Deltaproteobacteria bacterium]
MESDLEAIARLIHLYAERLDAGDFEGVADLFARATFRSDRRPEVRRGSREVLEVYRGTVLTYEDGRPSTRHVTTNLVVDVAADRDSASA